MPFESEHGNRIDSCTIELAVDGLAATPEAPVPVAVTIWAIAPTVGEGTRDLLVDEQTQATVDALDLTYPMTDPLAPYAIKTNGYRLAVAVTVGGAPLGEREVWLGCGADQTGHPNRILFEKVWLGGPRRGSGRRCGGPEGAPGHRVHHLAADPGRPRPARPRRDGRGPGPAEGPPSELRGVRSTGQPGWSATAGGR